MSFRGGGIPLLPQHPLHRHPSCIYTGSSTHFWGCCWNYVHKNPFERCLWFQWIFGPSLSFVEWIWHDVQKVSGYILSSISFQTFAVSTAINYLVDMCPNLWCNNYKSTFFLGAIFFDLVFSLVFTKKSCFLCALCGRVTAFSFLYPDYTAQNIFEINKYVPN